MKAAELKQIIKQVIESPIMTFSLETEHVKVSLSKSDQGRGVVTEGTLVAAAGSAEGAAAMHRYGGAAASPAGEAADERPGAESERGAAPSVKEVKSPMVGVFYASSEPGGPPFVQVGDTIAPDTVVGVVEAMKLLHEVRAGVSGVLAEIVAEDGQFVEYEQVLLRLKGEGD